jgi:hypothetical protein
VTVFLAAGVAFDVVFGSFVLAMLVLAALTMRWAIRRDKAGWAEWARRRREPHGRSGSDRP